MYFRSWYTGTRRVSSLFGRPSAGIDSVSREAPLAVVRRMPVRPPAPLALLAASPPAIQRWLHASFTTYPLTYLTCHADRISIGLRRHGGGQGDHRMILAATVGAEQLQLASGHGRSPRRQGAPRFFTSWARWALLWWLRNCCLSPFAARPPLGGRFARASRSLRRACSGGSLGHAWCVARCGVARGRSAKLANRLAKKGGVDMRLLSRWSK